VIPGVNADDCEDAGDYGGYWITVDTTVVVNGDDSGYGYSTTYWSADGDWGYLDSGQFVQNPLIPGYTSQLKTLACEQIPQGRVVSAGGTAGGVGSVGYSASLVLNYNTGQESAFLTGSLGGGWNAGASSNLSAGLIYGNLGDSNAGFSGPFQTISGGSSEGPGGYVSWSNDVTVIGGSVSASAIPTPTGSYSRSTTTKPLQLGNGISDPLDGALYLARQVCKE
jgi:hypothetical protein